MGFTYLSHCLLLLVSYSAVLLEARNTKTVIIRLGGLGGGQTSGRVEIFYRDEWGTICDDSWDDWDAKVVCRMLGMSGGVAYPKAWFGQGTGNVTMTNVDCRGKESSILECTFAEENYCSHREDASVVCTLRTPDEDGVSTVENNKAQDKNRTIPEPDVKIRLVGGDGTYGRVELFHRNMWGTVCNNWFDFRNAGVVCRMLGFNNGTEYKPPQGDGPIWLDGVRCKGHEKSLIDCTRKPWGDHDCFHTEDAGVKCSSSNTFKVSNLSVLKNCRSNRVPSVRRARSYSRRPIHPRDD